VYNKFLEVLVEEVATCQREFWRNPFQHLSIVFNTSIKADVVVDEAMYAFVQEAQKALAFLYLCPGTLLEEWRLNKPLGTLGAGKEPQGNLRFFRCPHPQ
jgi:hypothetical protein